jgi:hypothetical protein
VSDLFARSINKANPVKSLKLKRVLTKPLLAMAHIKQLLFTLTSDMFIMTLPAKGRGAAPSLCVVADGVDVENGQDGTLVMNTIMISALEKAGFRVVKTAPGEDGVVLTSETPGHSLVGKTFAFKRGDVNEEKGYRYIDVVEVDIER